MAYLTKKQLQEQFFGEFLWRLREAPPDTRVYMPVGIKDDCVDDVDRALNPVGQFFRHNAMHSDATRMVFDEFGRCARCVKLGFWKPDA